MTGPNHSGVELYGFLSYLVKVADRGGKYTVYGYKGKQVRYDINSSDLIATFDAFRMNPRPGEVYNLGGDRSNSVSILECFEMVEERLCKPIRWNYSDENRKGDHICYISDLTKLRTHFPGWDVKIGLERVIDEMVEAELRKNHAEGKNR